MAPETGHYLGPTRSRYKGTPGIRITAWECRCRAGAIPNFFGLTSTGVELIQVGLCTGTIPMFLWLSVATTAQRLPWLLTVHPNPAHAGPVVGISGSSSQS